MKDTAKYEGLEEAIRGELEAAIEQLTAVGEHLEQTGHLELLAVIQAVGMVLVVDAVGAMQVMHGTPPEYQVREAVGELVKAYGYVVVSLELEPEDGSQES